MGTNSIFSRRRGMTMNVTKLSFDAPCQLIVILMCRGLGGRALAPGNFLFFSTNYIYK